MDAKRNIDVTRDLNKNAESKISLENFEAFTNKINLLSNKVKDLEKQLLDEKIEKLKLSKTLYEQYSQMEELLQDLKMLEHRYNAIVSSKLGKLTLKYWKYRNRGRG